MEGNSQEFVWVSVAESAHGHTSDDGPGGREKVELRKIVSWLLGNGRGRGTDPQLNRGESFQ
jgi:hypothetical protein